MTETQNTSRTQYDDKTTTDIKCSEKSGKITTKTKKHNEFKNM